MMQFFTVHTEMANFIILSAFWNSIMQFKAYHLKFQLNSWKQYWKDKYYLIFSYLIEFVWHFQSFSWKCNTCDIFRCPFFFNFPLRNNSWMFPPVLVHSSANTIANRFFLNHNLETQVTMFQIDSCNWMIGKSATTFCNETIFKIFYE